MATIERISKETYRITKMYKGKRYRMTVDRKPSKQEAERLIWSMIEKEPSNPIYKTFQQAAESYTGNKTAVLSPATLKNYQSGLNALPDSFKDLPISSINNDIIQGIINEYASTHKPSSTKSLATYIGIIIHSANPDFRYKVRTPKVPKSDFYVPEDSDVQKILGYSKGTPYEIALRLATLGLRRSEICALERADLSKYNIITVNKAKVQKDGKWIIKITKTVESTRKVPCPDDLADLIRQHEDGLLFPYTPQSINNYLKSAQKKLGLKHFSPHKFRHYFASTAREVMPDGYVEKFGGWKPGSNIMKKIYDYTKVKQEKEAAEALLKRLGKLSG